MSRLAFGTLGLNTAVKPANRDARKLCIDPPSCIVLRLRHPDEKPIQAVTVNGKPHREFDAKAETISLSPRSGRLAFRGEYSK